MCSVEGYGPTWCYQQWIIPQGSGYASVSTESLKPTGKSAGHLANRVVVCGEANLRPCACVRVGGSVWCGARDYTMAPYLSEVEKGKVSLLLLNKGIAFMRRHGCSASP